jgi:heterotetrameric sarcosine oxidase gamma subunit
VSELIARSPIQPIQPVVEAGWEVSGRRSTAGLTLTDLTPLAKVGVRAPADGVMARDLGVRLGRAARDEDGALVIGSGPGEWLVLGPAGHERALGRRLAGTAASAAGSELVTVIDLTHGRALMRLTGPPAAGLLTKVCGIDFRDEVTPDGAAFRTSVARLVTDVARDDQPGPVRSYLLHCERSSGQYLFDALLDAGAEFGVDIDGFRSPGI